MSHSKTIDRRAALQAALGVVALGAGARFVAAATPVQTEGPFFPNRPQSDTDADMTRIAGQAGRAQGEVVEVFGQVRDQHGAPVADALIDVWQANTHGRYAHEADPNPAQLDPNFQGWARLRTDGNGNYRVLTIVPGAYPVGTGWTRPPHIHFKVALRGFRELTTQMYFAGHPLNEADRLLQAVPEAERGQLVVAFSANEDTGVRTGRFDIGLERV